MSEQADQGAVPSTIGLVGGTGIMGQMFKGLFEASGYRVLISGLETELSNERLVEASDVVIFAVPVRDTVSVIRSLAPLVRPGQLLSDFTSIKQEPVAAMLETDASVIGCHPIFGPLPTPEGQNLAMCPARPGPFLDWYRGFFESHGIRVVSITPEEHDESMAFIQGLTHFINITFANTLRTRGANLDRLLELCSPVYRVFFAMLSRILSGDPQLYGQIQITNRANIPVVKDFQDNGAALLRLVEREDWEGVYGLIAEAAQNLGDYKLTARAESDFLIEQMRVLLAGTAPDSEQQ
jgi:prephenate dehydrogenase